MHAALTPRCPRFVLTMTSQDKVRYRGFAAAPSMLQLCQSQVRETTEAFNVVSRLYCSYTATVMAGLHQQRMLTQSEEGHLASIAR